MTRFATAVLAGVLWAAEAFAQSPPVRPPRFEVSIGGLWLGGSALGASDAELRANSVTASPFRLFATESASAGAAGLEAGAAYWLSRTIAVEAAFVRVRPELRTRVSGDAEGAAGLTVAERLDQYFVSGNVVWLLEGLRFAGRTVPFVSGGGGYLRQLHEGRTLVATGRLFDAGGGVRHHLLGNLGWIRALGVKLDGRVYVLVDGTAFQDRPRTHGAFSGSVVLGF